MLYQIWSRQGVTMNMRARVMQVGNPVGCVTVSALLLEFYTERRAVRFLTGDALTPLETDVQMT